MEEVVGWVLRIGAFVGIGLFLWSVAGSLDEIAAALTRIAEGHPKPPPDQPK